MAYKFTSGLASTQVACVWKPDGSIFCVLDDRRSDKPRGNERLERDAQVIAYAMNEYISGRFSPPFPKQIHNLPA